MLAWPGVYTIRAIDLFCGAGGSSWGARLAGVEVIAGFDASVAAKRAFVQNFPDATFFEGWLEDIDPVAVKQRVGNIDLLLASPECTSHSVAKGAAVRSNRSRNTAFQVTRFAEVFRPRWVVVENVVSMRGWSGYRKFTRALEHLGYHVNEQLLNAADFGVPQHRRRLFLLCDRVCAPTDVKATFSRHRPVSRVLETNGTYSYSPLRKEKRASDTLARADRAIEVVGRRRSFLLVYYGSDGGGGWQRLSKPLRTITTLDRFAFVKPSAGGHVMRMLQVPELKRAMGMPQRFSAGDGSRRDRIRLIGNAVCPPVMRAVVRSLLRNQSVTESRKKHRKRSGAATSLRSPR
jgi:DNA (cytosine-5)-methyltransferase 1